MRRLWYAVFGQVKREEAPRAFYPRPKADKNYALWADNLKKDHLKRNKEHVVR